MIDPAKPADDERLEALLDGLAADGADATVDASFDPRTRRAVDLQRQIDGGLDRLFRVEPPSQAELAAALTAAAEPRREFFRRWWAAAAAAAVVLAGATWALTSLDRGPGDAPVFVARPLADVYRDVVAEGFEPYYECREADRFADTFARRQGQPLALLPLPEGVRMLGLSYPGGLSRETTAMLCHVDGEPVMVFVDRASADQEIADRRSDPSTHVFRVERHGLVFYEVTPLDSPRVVDYLAPAASVAPAADAG
jgi:hypothetical protein